MSDTTTSARVDLLERLADRIAADARERDHGIAWAKGDPTDLRRLLLGLDEKSDYPVEPDTVLISISWQPSMAGECARRLYTVELPSGRELLVDDFDVVPEINVIGVVERPEEHSHLRAVQAAISGEHTSEPLLVGFPDDVDIAFGGVVLVDALAEALRSSGYAAESLVESEHYWVEGIGNEEKERLLTALQEELDEPADDDRSDQLEEMLERAESAPSWLWAIDSDDAERLEALAAESPAIPLYAPPGIPASFDPAVSAENPLFQAAALLAACEAL